MTLVYCPGFGWHYHSLVDFQLGVKLDSISLPDICTESFTESTQYITYIKLGDESAIASDTRSPAAMIPFHAHFEELSPT